MPVDTMKKERVLIRFRPEIYECFELEAAYQGLRVGTIANQLLISELNKAASVKPEHCVVFGSEDYAANICRSKPESGAQSRSISRLHFI